MTKKKKKLLTKAQRRSITRKQYKRGRKKEYEIRTRLQLLGYLAERTAGSHGLWDITAVSRLRVRLIQAKWTATGTDSSWQDDNYRAFRRLHVPDSVTKEIWVFTKGNATPHVYYLNPE